MSHNHKQESQQVRPYKILAQTAGMAVCLFMIFFAIGEVLPAIKKDESNDWNKFLPLAMVLFPVLGYIISWAKELAGAIIMLLGGIILAGYFLMDGNTSMALIYGLPFMIAGALYLLHISKRKKLHHKK